MPGRSAPLAEAALESKMAREHGALSDEVDALAKTLSSARKLERGIAPVVEDEPYEETERRALLLRMREIADMWAKQLEAVEKIVDDVLWQDDRDTHSIYGTVLLLQPYVNDDMVELLRETCELNGDIPKPEAERRRTLG